VKPGRGGSGEAGRDAVADLGMDGSGEATLETPAGTEPGRDGPASASAPSQGTDPFSFPLEDAAAVLHRRIRVAPDVFVVLGSGLSPLVGEVQDSISIPYREIPGFPEPTVEGHEGHLVSGTLGDARVLMQAGRFHFYEGHPASVVVAPIRLAARLGARVAVLTNAAGSLNPELRPGYLLLLDDHINFMARRPLAGPVLEGEERFPDLSGPYDPGLQALAARLARELGIPLPRGTYAAVLGPSYETPAEVRFLASTGAAAVGMSTVPEAITARAMGMRVLAFSLLTNMAAGLSARALDHAEVLEMGRRAGGRLSSLLKAILSQL